MRRWREVGLPPEKLVVGMAAYGRCFNLSNPKRDGMGALLSDVCPGGNFARVAGLLAYNEVTRATASKVTD